MTVLKVTPVNGLSLAGLCATFVGNGVGRFAFIALMPALISAGWFSKGEASYLSVATLVGYLLGAQIANIVSRHLNAITLLRVSMLVCSVSYFACAIQGAGMPWYYLWRTLVGVCGAFLMVLAAPVVLPRHDKPIWGRVSGVVFAGIGLGAVLSGFLVPLLIATTGPVGAWVGMGCLCLVLTLLAWPQWPTEVPSKTTTGSMIRLPLSDRQRWVVGLVLVAYALNAVGYLPHTMFWVDYIVRELHMPLSAGGFYWSVFGCGAAIGPVLCGAAADKFGLKPCLMVGFALKAVGVAIPLMSNDVGALFVSSLLVGLFTPGIVALVSTYTLEWVGESHHRRVWGWMTLSFSAAQAGGGFLMAYAAANMDSYQPFFLVSAVALLFSVACIGCVSARIGSQAEDGGSLVGIPTTNHS